MSEPVTVLDYARPVRWATVWSQPEAWMALLPNATLGVIAMGRRLKMWDGLEGMWAGLFVVAFALTATVTVIAAFGVLTAYIDGPTTARRQQTAWRVFAVALGNTAAFVTIIGAAVAYR